MERLLQKLLEIAIENAGAQCGCILLEQDGLWSCAATADVDRNGNKTVYSEAVVNYTARTKEPVVLQDASSQGAFTKDDYMIDGHIKSVLCVPFMYQGELSSILYLENNLTVGAFTADRVEMLELLSSQMAIAIQNAKLYANLEASRDEIERWNGQLEFKVEERTKELQQALKTVHRTQVQLLDSVKMASLGQLTAGIAHEINNPINFVSANINPLKRNIDDMMEVINRYEDTVRKHELQDAFSGIDALKKELEFDYLLNETQELLKGMEEGTKRTAEIVKDLRNFSRLDEDVVKKSDIHAGMESTLMLLKKKADSRVDFIRQYGPIGEIECFPGKLN
ncbi:MAG: GAF domain-containing protein [Paenibacillaceae bacterium]